MNHKKNVCAGCRYRRGGNSVNSVPPSLCHYCYDTGLPRGCSVADCYDKKICYKPVVVGKWNRGKKSIDDLWKLSIAGFERKQ